MIMKRRPRSKGIRRPNALALPLPKTRPRPLTVGKVPTGFFDDASPALKRNTPSERDYPLHPWKLRPRPLTSSKAAAGFFCARADHDNAPLAHKRNTRLNALTPLPSKPRPLLLTASKTPAGASVPERTIMMRRPRTREMLPPKCARPAASENCPLL